MAIDDGGGCVEPYPGRVCKVANDRVEQAGGLNAGVVNGFAMGGVVATIDVAPGEVDAHVGAFEVLGPGSDVLAIPVNGLPWRGVGATGEEDRKSTRLNSSHL